MTEQKIGRYIIKGELGEGAMGTVYKAYDPNLERMVAIKTIRVDRLGDDQARDIFKKRFFREAKIGGSLQDPNIVTLYDLGEHQEMPYIVMEFVEGDLLSRQMRAGEASAQEYYLAVLEQVARALETAHEMGIIHRDIKPQNMMITKNGTVKILDFGIAKSVGSNLTMTGEFLGTPKYSSPEQIADQNVDYRSDIFSLGVLAHEMITGKSPFPGSSVNSILFKIVHGDPEIGQCAPEIGVDQQALRAIFLKVLAKSAENRYQNATDFSRALRELYQQAQPQPVEEPEEEKTVVASGLLDVTEALNMAPNQTAETVRNEALIKESRIQKIRDRFHEALSRESLDECRKLLLSLKEEQAEHGAEEKDLAELESRLAAKAEEKRKAALQQQREREVGQKRQDFHRQLKAGHTAKAKAAIEALKSLKATVDEETNLLEKYKRAQAERAQKLAIERARERFDETVKNGDLAGAKQNLKSLQELGVDREEHRKAVDLLRRKQAEEERLRREKVAALRGGFRDAIVKRNVREAEKAITELRQLKVNIDEETESLNDLKKAIDIEEKERKAAVRNLQTQYRKGIKKRDQAAAQTAVDQLRELGEDVSEQTRGITDLEKTIRASTEQERERKRRKAARVFQKAVTRKNIGDARAALGEMARLGADISDHQLRLEKIQSADPAPEKKALPWVWIGAGAAVVAIGVFVVFQFAKPSNPDATDPETVLAKKGNGTTPQLNGSDVDLSTERVDNPREKTGGAVNPDSRVVDKNPDNRRASELDNLLSSEKPLETDNTLADQQNNPPDPDKDTTQPPNDREAVTPIVEKDQQKPVTKDDFVDLTPTNTIARTDKNRDKPRTNINEPTNTETQIKNSDPPIATNDRPGNTADRGEKTSDQKTDGLPTQSEKDLLVAKVEDPKDEPDPVEKTPPPEFLQDFRHEPRGRYFLGKKLRVEFDKKTIPAQMVREVAIMWRVDDGTFVKLPMAVKGRKYSVELPGKELKQGSLEYYFSVSMKDGKEYSLKNGNSPYASKIQKRSGAVGF